jgi:carboxylate-amine ligase
MRSAAINPAGWPTMPSSDGTGPDVTVLGEPPGTARAADGITLGVEEEFVLLDPSTGTAVPAGPDLVRVLDGEPGVQQELMRFQVETATRVCTSLDDVGRELVRLRRLVADAAASLGCRLVASGIAPYHTPGLAAVTDQPRYRKLARYYGPLVAEAGSTCGCHVHVGVPSRDLGVQVLARLRPWLASLLAITANSPIAGGHDTAWASCRYPAWSRWPTAAPPAVWPDAAAYDAVVRRLIGRGAALDERNIYLLARLSPRYPTVEVRVADACLDAGTAVLLAGLTRALVATALAEARRGTPVPAAPTPCLAAALAAAARHGLAGPAVDPFTGQAADARSLRSRLLDYVYPALSESGDAQTITGLLRRLDYRGTGADRQRALFASGVSPPGFVKALARATLSGDVPGRWPADVARLSPATNEPPRRRLCSDCRMVVIFGFGPDKQDDLGEVAPCVCPNCHNQVFLHHVRSKKSVRLYFVPVVPYGTDDYLVCPVCSRGLQISGAQLPGIRSMSGATAAFRAGRLAQAQYMARAERFWHQLGVNPAGQQLFSAASPGAPGPARPATAARPATPVTSATPAQPPPVAADDQTPWISHLRTLAQLHDQGVLSDAAYEAAKRRVLEQD